MLAEVLKDPNKTECKGCVYCFSFYSSILIFAKWMSYLIRLSSVNAGVLFNQIKKLKRYDLLFKEDMLL